MAARVQAPYGAAHVLLGGLGVDGADAQDFLSGELGGEYPRVARGEHAARNLGVEGVEARLGDPEAVEAETTRMLEHFAFPRELWDLYPNTFSGGEKLRLNIARAMVRRPRLLLLDEPTASLDNASKVRVRDLIEQLKAGGTTMLGIFHDLEFMEGVCDREYNMQAGGFVTE